MAASVPTPPERFLDAATRTFGDNAELQIIARHELEEAISDAPDASDSFEDMRATLDAEDTRPSRFSKWLFAVIALASLALFTWTLWWFYSKRHEIHWIESAGSFAAYDVPAEKLTGGLSPSQRLLLLGDPEASPEGNRMKRLWQSDPGNRIYFAEHARHWVAKSKSMPAELGDAARQIDPDNGYFHYLAAAVAADKCVEEIKKPLKKGTPLTPKEYRILDEPRWNQTLDHLHAAAAAPTFQSHEKEILLPRLELLPVPGDILSSIPKVDYLFGGGRPSISDAILPRVVATKAQECLKQGDREAFLKLVETWDRLLPRLFEVNRPMLIRNLLLRAFASAPLENFIATADGLNLPELAADLRTKKEKLNPDNAPVRMAMRNDQAKNHVALHGGLFQQYFYYSETPPDEGMRPGRLAEYAMMDRVAALAAWIILALATLLVGLYRFRASGAVKRVSHRLSPLVTHRDLLQIVAGGVLLPFVIWLVVIHFTPLGGREWNFHAHGGIIVVGQLLAAIFLVLLIPLILARRRLSRRAGRLGLHAGSSVFGWLAVSACILAIPLFYVSQRVMIPTPLMGSGGIFESSFVNLDPGEAGYPGRVWLWVAIGLLAFAAAYGIVTLLRSLFSQRKHLLRRVILSRVLVPSYLAGTLLFALSMPAYHAVERFWFARDETSAFLPEYFGLTKIEALLLEQDSRQLRGILEKER